MSNAPEEFEKLQKVLKLKRHEQPPPGYFNNFSTNVINRIERAARQESPSTAWFSRLLALLESNPVASGLFGMSVCGLLITGIAYSQSRPDPGYSENSNLMLDLAADSSASAQAPALMRTASVDSLSPSASALFTTNAASLFDVRSPGAQLISYQPK